MKRGFTLVELLAVIVILAIILAITIPGISNVINSSRLNSFNISSKMLREAAKTYVNANNISVTDGTTTQVLYSDIKDAGYISNITDPISKNECINSRVYVTNIGGNYTYKGALVCDNYMDIDAYNLVVNGDFNNGTTGWFFYNATSSVANQVLSMTGNGSSAMIYAENTTNTPVTANKVIFVKANIRVTNSSANYIRISLYGSTSGTILAPTAFQNNPTQNNWYDMYGIATIPTSDVTGNIKIAIQKNYVDATTANGKIMQTDGNIGVYILDLTAIYGTGSEPTATQINNIMSNMGK